MKAALLGLVIGLGLEPTLLAQGTFNFDNRVDPAIDAPIFDCAGNKLSGDAYLAQLWAGPDAASLVAIGDPVPFRTGAASGYIYGAVRMLPTGPDWAKPGAECFVQFRAWAKAAGATWDAAKASGVDSGELCAPLKLRSGGLGVPPSPAANLVGLTGICCIPESSVLALFLLGASRLLFR